MYLYILAQLLQYSFLLSPNTPYISWVSSFGIIFPCPPTREAPQYISYSQELSSFGVTKKQNPQNVSRLRPTCKNRSRGTVIFPCPPTRETPPIYLLAWLLRYYFLPVSCMHLAASTSTPPPPPSPRKHPLWCSGWRIQHAPTCLDRYLPLFSNILIGTAPYVTTTGRDYAFPYLLAIRNVHGNLDTAYVKETTGYAPA